MKRNGAYVKNKPAKTSNPLSLPAIVKEVKQTVSVFLNDEGVANLKGTPYLREGAYIACSQIIDDSSLHYLSAQVRYYKKDSNLPKYAYLSIPHSFVKYLVSASPFSAHRVIPLVRRV